MNPITIPNITIPVIGLPTIGIPSVGFPSASGGDLVWPKGLKESIKAIYDPTKQGMTNYDVIEAYVEDFTTWGKYTNGVSVTNNTITISANINMAGNWIAWKESYIDSMVVYVSGLSTAGSYLIYGYNQLGKTRFDIRLKDGINIIPINEQYKGGFYGNASIPFTNDVIITQLPTSILKDLSGNGNHAYLYGGKGNLNSGIGLYTYDYNSDRWSSTGRADYIITKKGFEFTNIIEDGGIIFTLGSNIAKEGDKVKVKISGIPNGGRVYFGTWITATEDGEYLGTYAYDNNGNTTIGTLGCIGATITLEFIPDYPNQLCYDGKMYAVCYDFPILEDYTVMADRTWFDTSTNNKTFISKRNTDNLVAAFLFEKVNGVTQQITTSFGESNSVEFAQGISYQSKNSYNGIAIKSGNTTDIDTLVIGGSILNNNFSELWQGCHGKIIIADRSFTEDEITWLKDKFFTIDIPTPAYDFDFSKLKSGENTFADKYGNELSLYNFAWSGMSGKDGYNEDFTTWKSFAKKVDIKPNSAHVFLDKFDSTQRWILYIPQQSTANSINVKISGLKKGQSFRYYWTEKTKGGQIIIDKNGIYSLPAISSGKDYNGFVADILFEGTFDVTITQLPLYSNALIFDGIDDYASFQKTSKLIKSVIVDFIPLKHEDNHGIIYDQRLLGSGDVFAIYHAENLPAYSARNNGDTYIDGVLNTTLIPEQLTGKHMQVAITNNNILKMNEFIFIGCRATIPSAPFYSAMALYRITGFTEVLTPDQVWKWYQKNKLKGGDK
ncbi:hypothetical protein [Bacteroides clarus]|uniref:hypothetical protein n=1 Tax=Bacteroides clarus TaxID=626929 RepID=UPI00189C1E36|nr:hypothetical protein [Bacteroides clarus]